MPLVSASIDTFVVTSIAVVIPTLLLLRRQQSFSQAPYRNALTALVIFHTIYILYVICVLWPPNIFQRLHIPLNTQTDRIRRLLLKSGGLDGKATLPKPLESLLTRLSSFDTRSVYVRFGQSVLQDCEHCRTLDQYALYALPAPLVEFIREGALIGLLTVSGSHRARWRTPAIITIVGACLAEGFATATVPINIPRNGKNVFMWHDNMWLIRQVFFLVFPIIIHSLPPSAPMDPVASVMGIKAVLEITSRRLAFLKFLRGAVLRDPALRASANTWWERQDVTGQWIREDENVQRTAETLGSGFNEAMGEAKLLPRLKEIVGQLKTAALGPPLPPLTK